MVIDRIETVAVRFPSSPANEAAAMDNLLRSTFPGKALTVSLEPAHRQRPSPSRDGQTGPVETDPPPILPVSSLRSF